jgi:cytochrome c-type biogenesis protein
MENVSLLVAFSAGLLSFLSPCVLPLVPVYLASLYGPEIFETRTKRFRMPVFLHALAFVIGFTVVFTLFGAGAGLVGFALSAYITVIRQIAGILLIVFGAFLLLSLKVPWLNFEKRLAPSQGTTIGYLRSFFTGGIFSLAWTPCIGPILAGILTLAMGSETAGQGAYLLAIYSLGLGLPFLVVGAAFDSITPLLRRIHRYSVIIYIISGVLLIIVGILILANKMIWFAT